MAVGEYNQFGVWSLEFGVWSLEFGVWSLEGLGYEGNGDMVSE